MKHVLLIVAAVFTMLSLADVQAAGGTPQVRSDSDAHWEWRDGMWPNAEQAGMIRKSAENGDAEAQFKLALMYEAGRATRQDSVEAAKWLRKAADQGHVEAQYNLATMYDNGNGVTQNFADAARWYRAAAERGYTSAQKNLGVKYGLGQGVPQSDIEAFIWSAIAAVSGDEGAIKNRNLAASKLSPEELEAAQRWASKRYQAILQEQPGQQSIPG